MSPMGEAVTRLPASVARFLICREAKTQSILSIAGCSPPSASSIIVSVAAPPMRHSSGVEVIARSSATPSVETRNGNRLSFLVTSTPISVAPATSTASGCSARIRSSSSSEVGRRKVCPAPRYASAAVAVAGFLSSATRRSSWATWPSRQASAEAIASRMGR
jgi:hypothetical protein